MDEVVARALAEAWSAPQECLGALQEHGSHPFHGLQVRGNWMVPPDPRRGRPQFLYALLSPQRSKIDHQDHEVCASHAYVVTREGKAFSAWTNGEPHRA